MVLSIALYAAPAESSEGGVESTETKTVDVGPPIQLAQFNLGRILGGGSNRSSGRNRSGGGGEGSRSSRGGSGGITIPLIPGRSGGYGEGDDHRPSTIIPIPIPIPTRRTYTQPRYYPPRTTTTPNATPPPEPETPPEPNLVIVKPEENDFLSSLDAKVITAEQVAAFQDQISKKTDELGGQLNELFGGNAEDVAKLIGLAKTGKLDSVGLRGFVLAAGAGLNLQQQLQATGLLRQVAFNNMAMAALLSVNFNNLNVNIGAVNLFGVNVNVNVMGGGVWVGYWGFPWWPWAYPVWLGPGMWWGPCACPCSYYNPHLIGVDANHLPYSLADPVPDYQGEVVRSGILLTNVGTSEVNYTIDGHPYSMQPDYRQPIARVKIVVAFDRGGSFGKGEYGIDQGWYKFTLTDKGWELYKHVAKVTINNGDNSFPFRYVLDNQRQTLQGGYQQEHTGAYPLELRFDNGRGQVKQKIVEKGVYRVAVASDGGLDLFRPENVTMPAPIAEMSKTYNDATKNIFAEPDKIPSLFGDTAVKSAPAGPTPPAGPSPGTPNLFGPPGTTAPAGPSPGAPNLFGPGAT